MKSLGEISANLPLPISYQFPKIERSFQGKKKKGFFDLVEVCYLLVVFKKFLIVSKKVEFCYPRVLN